MNLKKNASDCKGTRRPSRMRGGRCLVVLLLLGSLGACGGKTLPPPQWEFERDAVKIAVTADPELNLMDQAPHTLFLCIYQLKTPTAFNRLAADTAGLYELLECELFDSSVATSRRLFVHPGRYKELVIDRAAGVRHIAVVAGYYTIEKERIVRIFDIPVVIEKKGFFGGKKTQKAGNLEIELTLGPKQILSAKGN